MLALKKMNMADRVPSYCLNLLGTERLGCCCRRAGITCTPSDDILLVFILWQYYCLVFFLCAIFLLKLDFSYVSDYRVHFCVADHW
jgi:hypothetical protein